MGMLIVSHIECNIVVYDSQFNLIIANKHEVAIQFLSIVFDLHVSGNSFETIQTDYNDIKERHLRFIDLVLSEQLGNNDWITRREEN